MRSSKSRSRSKTNRPRTLGNIINRVFDSSGPEGKVRGTPQQIIEKYQMLARDAQLSNDRVAAENFLQHAEHYTRLLAEAMREQAAEQESRMGQNGGQNGGQGNWQNRSDPRQDNRYDTGRADVGEGDQPYVAALDVMDGDGQVLDLPESDMPPPAARGFAPRPQRQNEGRQNNRPREDRPRDDRPRDERPRDDRARDDRPREERPRDERPRDERPREDRPRNERIAKPNTPELRFVEKSSPMRTDDSAPAPLPIFESPAALVAQLAEAPAPKPRVSRAKRAAPAAESETSAGTAAPQDQLDV